MELNDENIAEILFENSEEFPNNIYVELMNMVKIYHDTRQNGKNIKNFLKENKNKIDKNILKKINGEIKIIYDFSNIFYCLGLLIAIGIIIIIVYKSTEHLRL